MKHRPAEREIARIVVERIERVAGAPALLLLGAGYTGTSTLRSLGW